MICNKCNHQLPDDSEFCQYCGSKVEEAKTIDDSVIDCDTPMEELNKPNITKVEASNLLTCNKKSQKDTTKAKYCQHCGNIIDTESKMCTGCGKQYFKGIGYYLHHIFTKKHMPLILVAVLLVISLIANIVLTYHLNKRTENPHTIDKSLYTVCTVDELYKNPQKYNRTQVAVTSWKVISQYRENTVAGTYYDFLLCDDLTHYSDKSNYPIVPVYNYYKECIQPFNTPYVGVIVYSDFIYVDMLQQVGGDVFQLQRAAVFHVKDDVADARHTHGAAVGQLAAVCDGEQAGGAGIAVVALADGDVRASDDEQRLAFGALHLRTVGVDGQVAVDHQAVGQRDGCRQTDLVDRRLLNEIPQSQFAARTLLVLVGIGGVDKLGIVKIDLSIGAAGAQLGVVQIEIGDGCLVDAAQRIVDTGALVIRDLAR